MPRRIERYAKRLGIYLWPSVEADALVLEIAKAIPTSERPQDIYRKAMLIGLRELAAMGELPEKVLRHNRIGERLARRLPPAFTAPVAPHPGVPALPAAHAPTYPQDPAPFPAPFPAPAPSAGPAPLEFEDAEEGGQDIEAMLRLMGGDRPMTREDL